VLGVGLVVLVGGATVRVAVGATAGVAGVTTGGRIVLGGALVAGAVAEGWLPYPSEEQPTTVIDTTSSSTAQVFTLPGKHAQRRLHRGTVGR
jgi:hypothetical protein